MNARGRRSDVSFLVRRLALALAAATMVMSAAAQPYVELPLERTVEARLDPADPQHWYRVHLPDAGELTVRAESEADLGFDLRLYHEQSGLHSDTGGARQQRVVARPDLGTGTYLVRVDRVVGSGRYTLLASHRPSPFADDPEPNDRVEDAAPMALDRSREGRLGYLTAGRADTDDWFIADLDVPAALAFEIQADETLGFDARLYAPNGSSVLHGDTGGSRSVRRLERLDLAPGRYFLRLTRVIGQGGYRIEPRLVPQPIPADAEPNDAAGEAVVLRWNEAYGGQLGYTDGARTDMDDWFAFDLAEPGAVVVAVDADATLGLDARLYAANGSSVLHGDTGGSRAVRRLERSDLAPGRYFLRLTRVMGHGGYRFAPVFVAIPDLDERVSAASADAATHVDVDRPLRGLLGYTAGGATAGDAYHRFEHPSGGPVTIVATSQEPLAFDLRLYDTAGTVLRGDTGGSRRHRSLTLPTLEPGSYVVRLTRVLGHGTYALGVYGDRSGVAAHPERIVFPAVALGAEAVVVHAAVVNLGDTDAQVLAASVPEGAGFELRSVPTGVAAGAAGAFVVAFAPTAEGPSEATLRVATSVGDVAVPLRGDGYLTFPGVTGPATDPAGAARPDAPAAAPVEAPAKAPRDDVLAWTEAPRYAPGEPIVVHFRGLPGSAGDWITVIAAAEPDDRYASWSYTGGATSGRLAFAALPPGEYEVRVYFDWPAGGYAVRSRSAFAVAAEVAAEAPPLVVAPPAPDTPSTPDVPAPGATEPVAPPASDHTPPPGVDAVATDDPGAAQRVEHASGAVLDAPAGTLPAGHALVVETLAEPPSAEPFVPLGPALLVRNDAGVPMPARAVELVLPAPSEHAAVLFHSMGEWIRVPSEPVTLRGGGRGLAVRVDRVPLPWLVTVAELPVEARGSSDRAAGSGLHAAVARLEQLRVTDPDAMAAELARLDAELRSASSLQHASTAQGDIHAQLLDARLAFLRAYEATKRPEGRFSAPAALHYLDGIELLHRVIERIGWASDDVRRQSFSDRSGMDARIQGFVRDHVYGGRLTLADAVDYYAGTFAPWGVDLTRAILVGEGRALGRQFDVRVLPFFGREPFVNLLVPRRFDLEPLLATWDRARASAQEWGRDWRPTSAMDRGLDAVMSELRMVRSEASVAVTIRLFSPCLLDLTTNDLYAAAKTTLGGAAWLYGAASLAAAASAGTAIPMGTALVGGYNLVAPVVEAMFIEPRAERWAARDYASRTTSLTVYSGGKLLGSLLLDATDRGASAATGLTDMLLTYVIDYDRLAQVSELRGLGQWGVRNPAAWFFQDRRFYAPPVEVVFNVAGPTELRAHPSDAARPAHWPSTFESYVVGGHGVFSVFVDRNRLEPAWLRDGVRFEPMVPQEGTLFALPLLAAPFRAGAGERVSHWATLHHVEEAPHVQVLRWTLNASTLEAWAAALRLEDVDELLDRVTVEVRSALGGDGATPYRIFRHRADVSRTDEVDAKDATLARAGRPGESTDEVRAFAVALIESDDATPRPIDEYVGLSVWNEASVGEWSRLLVVTPSHRFGQFELEYEVRLVAGREEMLRFPVGFAYHAVDSVHVLVPPSGGLSKLPPRKIEVSTVRPDVAHEFRIDARTVEAEPTHSTYELAVLDRATTDLSGLRFTWDVVSQHGEVVVIGEQQGRPTVTLELPFDQRDHHPDPGAPPPGSSPFAVHVPMTVYTVQVEVTRDGRFVDRVERQVGVSGPYVIRIDQFGRD
jgi:hypothetical protein